MEHFHIASSNAPDNSGVWALQAAAAAVHSWSLAAVGDCSLRAVLVDSGCSGPLVCHALFQPTVEEGRVAAYLVCGPFPTSEVALEATVDEVPQIAVGVLG